MEKNEEKAADGGNDQQEVPDKHQEEPPLPPATDEKHVHILPWPARPALIGVLR
jgi:hypothetical protein